MENEQEGLNYEEIVNSNGFKAAAQVDSSEWKQFEYSKRSEQALRSYRQHLMITVEQ